MHHSRTFSVIKGGKIVRQGTGKTLNVAPTLGGNVAVEERRENHDTKVERPMAEKNIDKEPSHLYRSLLSRFAIL